jgi:riboflavin synthase
MKIASELPGAEITVGESIACDGACLTVTDIGSATFTVEASQETAARTIVGTYQSGSRLNLERAMRVGDRLGGHLVAGHVDDVGVVDYARDVGESIEVAVTFDRKFDPLVIDKGSIAINGVSLTVNRQREGWLSVNIIPHTAVATTIAAWRSGARVNLEFDMIGKYILKSQMTQQHKGSVTVDKLLNSGW